ncbi:MAG: type II toxin-antitoxin system PemK/MazF family toxin [Eubacterium sp.]|nr:type II toxin-antitoxin system PemK/MazF family toxin [Eubacterium sp.]
MERKYGNADDQAGTAMIEQLRSLDIKSRHYKRISEISFEQIQNISDAVQSIFDYYPW